MHDPHWAKYCRVLNDLNGVLKYEVYSAMAIRGHTGMMLVIS